MKSNNAKGYIDQMLDIHRHWAEKGTKIFGDPTPVYEFLMEHGREWEGTSWKEFKGSGWRRKQERHCFSNSLVAAIQYDLPYVEGYAYAGLLAVHHAWNLDDQGRVVDFTWRESVQTTEETEWEYFGVVLDPERVMRLVRSKPTLSVLYDLPYSDPDELKQFLLTPAEHGAKVGP